VDTPGCTETILHPQTDEPDTRDRVPVPPLNYLKDSEDNRKMRSLYLSVMDRFGVKLEQLGDSQIRLERL
jgi:hypothetical protein